MDDKSLACFDGTVERIFSQSSRYVTKEERLEWERRIADGYVIVNEELSVDECDKIWRNYLESIV